MLLLLLLRLRPRPKQETFARLYNNQREQSPLELKGRPKSWLVGATPKTINCWQPEKTYTCYRFSPKVTLRGEHCVSAGSVGKVGWWECRGKRVTKCPIPGTGWWSLKRGLRQHPPHANSPGHCKPPQQTRQTGQWNHGHRMRRSWMTRKRNDTIIKPSRKKSYTIAQ